MTSNISDAMRSRTDAAQAVAGGDEIASEVTSGDAPGCDLYVTHRSENWSGWPDSNRRPPDQVSVVEGRYSAMTRPFPLAGAPHADVAHVDHPPPPVPDDLACTVERGNPAYHPHLRCERLVATQYTQPSTIKSGDPMAKRPAEPTTQKESKHTHTPQRFEEFFVRWQNFRSLHDTGWVSIKGLTILIGANGSGKTSVIAPLLLLKQSIDSLDRDQSLRTRGRFFD